MLIYNIYAKETKCIYCLGKYTDSIYYL